MIAYNCECMWKVLLAITVAGMLAGCQPRPPAPTPKATHAPVGRRARATFGQTTLPARVNNMSGTALLAVASQLAGRIKAPGGKKANGFFLLLSPTNPSLGVVVRAGSGLTAKQLEGMQSKVVSVTGEVKTFADPTLAKWFETNFEVTVPTAGGKVQWIDNQAKLNLQPAAPSTPGKLGHPSGGK